ELYDASDIRTMQWSDTARLPGKNRVEEIRNYARIAGYKRIGIANCVVMQKEADQLKTSLANDFEVFSVDCKYGKISNAEMLGTEAKGKSCNPSGQADFLKANKTELNIVLGLCVGHDMVFTAKSHVPPTTLLVKDREHKHNPIQTFK
ncbi:MAG TPA: hypothetical protein DCL77_16755, partial [Prolixibacteraceae bacterium]|nr:hypothetical protein [Prolixibacteraceae bacterium]